jgi:hypothetical protein
MCFYNFGYQVHEKAILMISSVQWYEEFPETNFSLLVGEGEVHAKICLIFKIISTVSLFPLLIKNDGTMQFLTKCIIRNTN